LRAVGEDDKATQPVAPENTTSEDESAAAEPDAPTTAGDTVDSAAATTTESADAATSAEAAPDALDAVLAGPEASRATANNPFVAQPAGGSQPGIQPRRVPVPADPYHIAAGDVLFVSAIAGGAGGPVIDNDFVVEPSGSVALGPQFGRVKIGGLSLEDAEKAVAAHLKQTLREPVVQITVGGWRDGATNPSATADRRPPSSIRFPWEQPSSASNTPASTPMTAKVEPPLRQIGSEELAALREHVKFLEKHFRKADALFRNSTRGGSASSHALSAYELAVAKGELSLAEGNRDEAIRHLEAAQKWAQDAFVATDAAYQADLVTDDLLLQVARNLSETRRRLIQLRQPPQPIQPAQSRVSVGVEKSYPNPTIAAPAPGVTESLGVLKKIVQRAEQDYKRAKELADNNAVSAAEVARAQSEYEISVARLKQGERSLRFYQAQLDVSEADYQQLLEANKRAPGAITDADLRRAKLAVELGRLKLEELSE
jgi:tetratricopeptide (TPR) repeat protein